MKIRTGQTIFLEIRVDDHLSTHLKKYKHYGWSQGKYIITKGRQPKHAKEKNVQQTHFPGLKCSIPKSSSHRNI